MKSHRNGAAFTLIELLVVIAIIAILAALLSPGLKAARDSARSAKCLSNMRQVAMALVAYANDNNDMLPPFWQYAEDGVTAINWQELVGVKYLNEPSNSFAPWSVPADQLGAANAVRLNSVMHCPSDDTKWASWGQYVRSVAINGNSYPGPPPSQYSTSPPFPYPYGVAYRKLTSIGFPSELCLVADGGSGCNTTEWGYAARLPGICTVTAPLEWFTRHKKGMNCAMVDGHGEWHSADWIQNEWTKQGAENSRFFDWESND